MAEGQPRYVTAVSRSDVVDGWRDHRRAGGVVMDIPTGEGVLEGLSMPHSPRLYQDKLWLLESGRGHLGYVDVAQGRFEPVAFCPGYARGLHFSGDFAVVGLSRPRQNRTFPGLPLEEALQAKRAEARCGLLVIEELYEVAVLPDTRCPLALGLQSDAIRRVISLPPGP